MIPTNKIFIETWEDLKKNLPQDAFLSEHIKILKEDKDNIECVFKLDLYKDLKCSENKDEVLLQWKIVYNELENKIKEAIDREISNFLYASHPKMRITTSLKEYSVTDYRKKLEDYYNLGYFPGSLLGMFIDDFLN